MIILMMRLVMTFKKTILAVSLMAAASAQAAPSNEEIWQKLLKMQEQMADVQQQNQQLKVENETLKTKVEATEQVAIEANETAEALVEATEGAVQAASLNKTSIGGYGELHYNNLEDEDGKDKKAIDFHRFVLYFGHEFNNNLRFFSELELEHSLAGDGKPGEVELEQAYIEYDINEQHRVKGGLFLTPVGIINETHEPNTFYGTERNPVEKNIIPATWWAAGTMFSGELAQGFSYDMAVTSGLDVSKKGDKSTYKIRDGRQKVAKAIAEDLAYTGRLKWTAMPGVELAVTAQYQENMSQSQDSTAGSGTLIETHAVVQRGDFGLRALYATWDLDGTGPKATGYDEQTGWYIEPSYRISDYFGVFARYNEWDNQAGNNADTEYDQIDLGVNWWPHKDVVVKLDYQAQDKPKGGESDGFNIGLGYQF
jgi:hypothetical protein